MITLAIEKLLTHFYKGNRFVQRDFTLLKSITLVNDTPQSLVCEGNHEIRVSRPRNAVPGISININRSININMSININITQI